MPESRKTPTDRQQIEKEFHDNWAKSMDVSSLQVKQCFEASTALENLYALSQMGQIAGKRLLDLGAGACETSVYFASKGAHVSAVDISPEMLKVGRELAAYHGVQIETVESPAEALPFGDASFDVVFGNGVLHHVDYLAALKEVRRVLKPGGLGVFIEPLSYNPAIEVYRHLAKTVRTPTERPFEFSHLKNVQAIFADVHHKEFWLTTLLVFFYFFFIEWQHPGKVRYWKKVIEDAPRLEWFFKPLKSLDDAILTALPFFGFMCWNTVLTVKKEEQATG